LAGAIVLVSDCVDTASQVGLDGAITRAQKADIGVYALRMLDRDRVSKIPGDDHLVAPAEVKDKFSSASIMTSIGPGHLFRSLAKELLGGLRPLSEKLKKNLRTIQPGLQPDP